MQNVRVTRKGRKGPVPARLFILLARSAPLAIVFRRGPSRWVQLVKWRTDNDTIEQGQWFHGRVYERRSDLSPDGSLLIYFANKINKHTQEDKEYTYAWTAISKPPYLTALALWPKGDCWHGGGLFQDNKTVLLNHRRDVSKPHPEHKPSGLRIILRDNVCGEDDPIFSDRLNRDGWKLQQEWKVDNKGYPTLFQTIQPEVRRKSDRDSTSFIQLTRSITGLDYSEEFAVCGRSSSQLVKIERASWADWDQHGRLIYAVDGKLMTGTIDDGGNLVESEIVNLNLSEPVSLPTPDWASTW